MQGKGAAATIDRFDQFYSHIRNHPQPRKKGNPSSPSIILNQSLNTQKEIDDIRSNLELTKAFLTRMSEEKKTLKRTLQSIVEKNSDGSKESSRLRERATERESRCTNIDNSQTLEFLEYTRAKLEELQQENVDYSLQLRDYEHVKRYNNDLRQEITYLNNELLKMQRRMEELDNLTRFSSSRPRSPIEYEKHVYSRAVPSKNYEEPEYDEREETEYHDSQYSVKLAVLSFYENLQYKIETLGSKKSQYLTHFFYDRFGGSFRRQIETGDFLNPLLSSLKLLNDMAVYIKSLDESSEKHKQLHRTASEAIDVYSHEGTHKKSDEDYYNSLARFPQTCTAQKSSGILNRNGTFSFRESQNYDYRPTTVNKEVSAKIPVEVPRLSNIPTARGHHRANTPSSFQAFTKDLNPSSDSILILQDNEGVQKQPPSTERNQQRNISGVQIPKKSTKSSIDQSRNKGKQSITRNSSTLRLESEQSIEPSDLRTLRSRGLTKSSQNFSEFAVRKASPSEGKFPQGDRVFHIEDIRRRKKAAQHLTKSSKQYDIISGSFEEDKIRAKKKDEATNTEPI
eukprot:TRINITY_DN9888_c0_g1_i1.p1 TRINITY_DN9888_c0_g1~~TRINITY_DN9888_c0_g1_i1.p1  ORF type:complete len:568 (+),score=84.89 TRINITY_DN9888_c0_g1_i1:17-1720(+)